MVELIRQKGNVSFAQLKEFFPDVSEMTLRRDLEELDQTRQIVRVHGGAKSVDSVIKFSEDLYANRSIENTDRKMLIANKAIKLLHVNETIYIDSGTTTTSFSKVIPDDQFVIATSGLTCAIELSRLSSSLVYMLGGCLNCASLCVNGTQSIKMIEDTNFNIAFFGATGFTKELGFTVNVAEDYELKKAISKKAQKVVILMDSSKIGKESTYTYARLEDVDVLITDDQIDADLKKYIIDKGVEVY